MLKLKINVHGKFGNQVSNLSRGGALEAEMDLQEHHLSDLEGLRDTLTRLVWVMGNSLDAEAQRFTTACESAKPAPKPNREREPADTAKENGSRKDRRPVTPGQMRYLTALAGRTELNLPELVRTLHQCDPEQLSHKQASELIHQLVEVATEVAA